MEMSGFSEIPSKDKAERSTREEWEEIFELLDTKDGQSDGYIHRDTFLEWIDTLSFQDSISLEADRGISRYSDKCDSSYKLYLMLRAL